MAAEEGQGKTFFLETCRTRSDSFTHMKKYENLETKSYLNPHKSKEKVSAFHVNNHKFSTDCTCYQHQSSEHKVPLIDGDLLLLSTHITLLKF